MELLRALQSTRPRPSALPSPTRTARTTPLPQQTLSPLRRRPIWSLLTPRRRRQSQPEATSPTPRRSLIRDPRPRLPGPLSHKSLLRIRTFSQLRLPQDGIAELPPGLAAPERSPAPPPELWP